MVCGDRTISGILHKGTSEKRKKSQLPIKINDESFYEKQ
jgi:hypothetical protein